MSWGAWAGLGLSLACLAAVAASCGGEQTATHDSGNSTVVTGSGGGATSPHTTTATGGAGGSTASSTGGTGGGCPAAGPFTGAPIDTPAHQWTWVPFPGSKCRDGSEAGIGVRLNPNSKKVYVYLEGGGACFNATTCAIALTSFGKLTFDAWASTVGLTGIFNNAAPENPVEEWNAVYVPYCSGDVHAGSASDVTVPGVSIPAKEQFVGYENMALYLQRLVPTFHDATDVLLTGISAGGFGAALNYDRVASAFCPLPVTLLDDSGPPMSDTYLAPCLQKQWKGLWDLAALLPADCSACDQPNGGGIVNYVPYLGKRWPDAHLGLVSATHDSVISTFFGFGSNDCTSSTPLSGAEYQAGLEDLRSHYLTDSGQWATYYIDSISHTWLLGPGYYTTTVNGKKLTEWIGDLLAGKTSHVGP